MSKMIIKTVPGNWDESVIYPVGVQRGGNSVNPRTLTVKPAALPPAQYAVWAVWRELFVRTGDDDGGRKCVYLEVRKNAPAPDIPEHGDTPSAPEPASLSITSIWEWSDGRETAPEIIEMADPHAVEFFDWLMTDRPQPPTPPAS